MSLTLVASISVLLTVSLILFAGLGQLTRKVRLPGIVVPKGGAVYVAATQTGTLQEVAFKEGSQVRAGDVLFSIGSDKSTIQGGTAQLASQGILRRRQSVVEERTFRERQAQQRISALLDRRRNVEVELEKSKAEEFLLERRTQFANKSAERFEQLAKAGFVADLQAQARQEELLDVLGRQASARRGRLALERDAAAIELELATTRTQWQGDSAVFDRTLAGIDQEASENEARLRVLVVAPRAGRLASMPVSVGQQVQVGQTLVTLLPAEPHGEVGLEAQLYAPSRATGFVKVGQEVWVRYAAYPYQKFGMQRAEISAVSDAPLNAQDLPPGQQQALQLAAQTQEPLYRITLRLASNAVLAFGDTHNLKPGMALEADVVQDRRAIWEWLFEPLLAMRWKLAVSR